MRGTDEDHKSHRVYSLSYDRTAQNIGRFGAGTLEAIEKNGEALAVSLDISKAFDRVWHASLLSKLPAYGIPANFCTWISDFLSERSIRVVVEGCSSDLMAIDAGVPQGSVLSATLFLLHINDLLRHGIVGYADDSTVSERYLTGAKTCGDEIRSLRKAKVERTDLTLSLVSQWGDDNLHFKY